jgi:4-hydroxy-tetrahydrodipicolinate synthase
MFAGLSAFPLTPVRNDGIDEAAFALLVRRLAEAEVDSIGVLGSTGSYAYLNRAERAGVGALAVQNAGTIPVIIGVGALRTRDVLAYVDDAQNAGAAGVLVPAMTYQRLSDDEVYGLYEDVAAFASVPIVVYDNPGTTHVDFSDGLHGRIAQLPGVVSIKIPPVPLDEAEAASRVGRLRSVIPAGVGIGVSGDAAGSTGLIAGCETWYSVIAGILPERCRAITRAATSGDIERARELSAAMEPVWALMRQYGSYRTAAAVAEHLGLVTGPSLPRPVQGIDQAGRRSVAAALERIGITA